LADHLCQLRKDMFFVCCLHFLRKKKKKKKNVLQHQELFRKTP
jgi:hypothetical protein